MVQRCAGVTDAPCGAEAVSRAPVALCAGHLLEAYEWVAGEVGVTDVLPAPCVVCAGRVGVRYPSGWVCAVCEWRQGELPDGGLPAVRVEVVYYLRFRDQIKIGTSAGPRARLGQIRFDELLAFERGGRALEQRRHAQFAEHRVGGEWFTAHPSLIAHIDGLRVGGDDPWNLHRRWVSEELARAGS